jgi:hypothetical protein
VGRGAPLDAPPADVDGDEVLPAPEKDLVADGCDVVGHALGDGREARVPRPDRVGQGGHKLLAHLHGQRRAVTSASLGRTTSAPPQPLRGMDAARALSPETQRAALSKRVGL